MRRHARKATVQGWIMKKAKENYMKRKMDDEARHWYST